jgi:hypothetical protein
MRLISLLILLSVGTVAAQTPDTRERLDKLRAEGYEALYNLDYQGARKRFREMIQLAPDNPAGPQCYAASLWVATVKPIVGTQSDALQHEGLHRRQPQETDRAQTAEFRKWIRQAKILL